MTIDVGQFAANAAVFFIFFAIICATLQKYVPQWPFPGSASEWGMLSIAAAILSKL